MNKKITFKKLAAVAFVLVGVMARGETVDRPSTWLAVSATGYLDTNKTVKVFIQEENRFDSKHLQEVHGQASVGFKITDWLTIAPRIHEVYARNDSIDGRRKANKNGYVDHGWDRELRLGADTTFSYNLYGWKLTDRNRTVYRVYEDDEGYWRYRNQIGIAAPWKWTDWKINPYVTWEGFLDDGKPAKHVRKNDKFDIWWGTAGFKAKVTRNLDLNLFYRLVERKDTTEHNWRPSHVVGLYANLTF